MTALESLRRLYVILLSVKLTQQQIGLPLIELSADYLDVLHRISSLRFYQGISREV